MYKENFSRPSQIIRVHFVGGENTWGIVDISTGNPFTLPHTQLCSEKSWVQKTKVGPSGNRVTGCVPFGSHFTSPSIPAASPTSQPGWGSENWGWISLESSILWVVWVRALLSPPRWFFQPQFTQGSIETDNYIPPSPPYPHLDFGSSLVNYRFIIILNPQHECGRELKSILQLEGEKLTI